MSSTSAVGVLAQGLRDLRDFAEGPEDGELRERTGLTAGQIGAALAGGQLPTREVTLALVEAWEGDVEAWREYWGQIAELAEEDEGEGRSAGEGAETPAPPEPSIITPIPEQEPDQEPESGETQQAEPESVEPEPEDEPATERETEDAEVKARAEEAEKAEEAKVAEAEPVEAEPASAQGAAKQAEQKAAETEARSQAAGSQSVAEPPARAESASQQPPALKPSKNNLLARVGIPVVLFAVGVGVGAFGDHALSSKQSSSTTAASLPPVATSSRPSHTAALSPSSSGASSSATSAGSTPSPTDSSASGSASTSSTVAPGTVLGAYVGIQLASGYSVNFVTDPYHPSAGTSNGPDTMGFFAGSFVDGRFYADRVAILDATDTGSFTSCLNDTRYQHDILLSQISTGSSFCITTGTGHLVLVTVRRLPSSTDANPYAVLDVTVWQGGSAA